MLSGVVLARRNVAIANGILRRVGCPQGTFVGSLDGEWFELEGSEVALLEGGQGTAARAPKLAPRRRMETARTHGSQKSLPEIAALIDPEQFSLITAPDAGLIVIQGGAGSGKTTVALHRIAYLVFEGRGNTFKPSRCLFVVPSDALARYVAGVLPALGVQGVPVTTFRSWARSLRQRLISTAPNDYNEETPSAVSRLKKHPAMLPILESLVAAEMRGFGEDLITELAGSEGREQILAWWEELEVRPPISRVRRMKTRVGSGSLPAVTIHRAEPILRAMTARLLDLRGMLFDTLTDRQRMARLTQASIEPASASEVDELVRWCSAQLEESDSVTFEGIDEERLQTMDGRAIDDSQEGHAARAKSDVEDDALLLRLYQIVHGHLERVDGEPLIYDHIALDEAQDFSPVEVKLLYAATDERKSFTISGDVAQRVVFDNAFRGWEGVLSDLGIANGAEHVKPLALSYRSTAQVMQFARTILGPLAANLSETAARQGAEVSVHGFEGMGEAVGFVADSLRSLLARESQASVALIARHIGQADAWFHALVRAEVPHLRRVRRQEFTFDPGIDITDATQVKGLEFDYVLLLDVTDASYPDNLEARHLLHIGATRATHQLWVIVTGRPSPLLAGVAAAAELQTA